MNKKEHEKCFGKGKLQNRKLFRDAMKSEELLNQLIWVNGESKMNSPENGKEAWEYTDAEIVDEARYLLSFWWLEGGTTHREGDMTDYYRTVRQLKSFLKKHGQSFPKINYDLIEIDGMIC
jgi:hypothetical protein